MAKYEVKMDLVKDGRHYNETRIFEGPKQQKVRQKARAYIKTNFSGNGEIIEMTKVK